jgi:prepilin-type N-terminal cleavage/methylation domain-containing protein
MNRFNRGVSLIEILVVSALVGILAYGSAIAIVNGANYEVRLRNAGAQDLAVSRMETTLRDLIEGAYLSVENTTTTFFIGSEGPVFNGTGAGNADTITFTRIGSRLPGEAFDFDDFETANQELGPIGGCEEITISLTPTGSPTGATGLYLRRQTPSDGDPSQGGREELLLAGVQSIAYEFFDGLLWQTVWDTQSQGPARLPAAVRITYSIEDGSERVLVVRPRASDVTPDNPVQTEAEG